MRWLATGAALPGTGPLAETGDLAAAMVAGIGRFLDRALQRALAVEQDAPSAPGGALSQPGRLSEIPSVQRRRERLARILGVVDARRPATALEPAGPLERSSEGPLPPPALVARRPGFDAWSVRWPVLEGVDGEGLLLRPPSPPIAHVVALPDADWLPEQLAGLVPGVPVEAQFACRLAELGCEVVVPVLIDRRDTWSGNPAIRLTNQPHREFIYRMAFELGRHVIGYEIQKVLSLVDLFTPPTLPEQDTSAGAPPAAPAVPPVQPPLAVFGYGEGGLLALYAAALDPRIVAAGISGYVRDRRCIWQEPIYRNVWGLLRGFADAEVIALIAPRAAVIEATPGPILEGPPAPREGRRGAAPGALAPIPLQEVRAEVERARRAYAAAGAAGRLVLVEPPSADPGPGSGAALHTLLRLMGVAPRHLAEQARISQVGATPALTPLAAPEPPTPLPRGHAEARRRHSDGLAPLPGSPIDLPPDRAEARQRRQFEQLCAYTQRLMHLAWRQREAFWSRADATSPEAWQASTAWYRTYCWDELIGRLPPPSLPPSPRTRRCYRQPGFTGYEVVLDLWPDVFAYGVLLVPAGMPPNERRPVVVCQHGLEGRPQMLVEQAGPPYRAFAARLAERGYVVYAPQNPYIGGDTFRLLQRKANPLGWSLFSFIVAQHQRTLEWLATLPFVDPQRISFYGLSYGGKTAMRVPALLEGYCLSICSGDFNEWLVKCASTDLPMSYLFTGEWEMFEFDLGHTFSYAELAYLIAPRPFMVERGHRDGVGLDEWVAFEYARVRRRYADLGLPERTAIAFFDGGHMIDGRETFAFLDRHLRWMPPAASAQ